MLLQLTHSQPQLISGLDLINKHMKNLMFTYKTIIAEPYVDIISSRRNYKATITNEAGETVKNPQDKFEFVSNAFTKLIDTSVIFREFSDINEELINKQSYIMKAQSDSRILSKIEQVRIVEIEITSAPTP